jgi:hypothetical protein
VVQEVSGLSSFLTAAQLKAFEQRAQAVGLPYRRDGAALAITLASPR